jgi:hypothetical protein
VSAGAEVKAVLEVAALAVSLGTVVFHFGVSHQRIRAIERRQEEQAKRFDEFMAACKHCKADLDAEDSAVHGRVTVVSERVARLEGQMKGVQHGK